MTEVNVETPEETPEETQVNVSEGDTTVVVETPPETPEVSEDLAVIVGGLVERVNTLESRVLEAQVTADMAEDVAEEAISESVAAEDTAEDVGEAVETVADAVANDEPEELQETAEVVEDNSDTILPTKKHFVHRSWRELMGR